MCTDPTAGQQIYVVENSGYFISQVCIKVVPDRAATIHWNRIVSRYFFWRYAYRIVRSFHDTLTIQHFVLYIKNEF